MPHAAATAAALGLLLAASATAGDLEDRYRAGLLGRGLFAVAEGDALRTFDDRAATPTARQAAAVRLAAALAEHSRFADGDERAALLERAAETLAAAAAAFPELPAVRTDLARGLVAAADAKRRARDALPDLRPAPAALTAAENALGVADARLDRVHAELDRRRRDLARGRSRDTEPLTAEELGDLAERAAIALAEVRALRAELADRDGERRRLAGDAAEFAAPVRRAGLLSRRAVTLCDSRRLSGDSRGAAEALAAAPQPRTDVVTAADLRLRAVRGAADAADRVIALRRAAGGEAAVLGPETEFAAARILAALAREARTAGRADLADQLVARLSRDADRAAAALGGPWAARAGRVAALAARHAGLSPELASRLEDAEELAAAGSPRSAAAFAAAADAALAAESADAAVVLPLATRAAAAATTAADRTAAAAALAAALKRFPAADGSAAAHFALCSLLGQAYAADPTAETQRALADALVDHRLRFPDSPTAAAATWRLARHEEVRDQRSAALRLFRALLDDPARGPAAAAALARCHAGILAYLAERERLAGTAGDGTTALARRLQLADRRAAARAELGPLAEAPDRPDAAPADRTAGAELRLRTARLLTDDGAADPAEIAAADGLLVRLRNAAAAHGSGRNAAFWAAVGREAAWRETVTAAAAGRFADAAALAADLPDDPAGLAAVSDGWDRFAPASSSFSPVGPAGRAFAAARVELADRLLKLPLPAARRRAERVRRAGALLAAGEPSDAAADLLDLLADGHDPAAAALAARAVAASRSPELAAAAADAWRRAEANEREGSAGWLAARARRVAGLHAAGKTDEAARLLSLTRVLHPELKAADPAVRRRFAALDRAVTGPRQ